MIGDPVSGELLYEALIAHAAARRAAKWADAEDRTTVFYLNQSGGRTRLVQNYLGASNGAGGREGWDSATYDHWFGSPREIHASLSDVLHDSGARPLKFITVNDHAQEPDLTAALQLRFGSDVHMSRSHQLLVEGTAPTANKGHALDLLADRLGIDPARVLAIGDNENDIPMLRAAGLAVCMGQATAVVRAEADWVAPTLEEDGAAVAMERFCAHIERASATSRISALQTRRPCSQATDRVEALALRQAPHLLLSYCQGCVAADPHCGMQLQSCTDCYVLRK